MRDPHQLERRLTDRSRAVVAVHYAGVPADMEAIGSIAKSAGLVVIEDAAHAIGARVPGGEVGTLGDLAVFSLHPAKQLTAGEAGLGVERGVNGVEVEVVVVGAMPGRGGWAQVAALAEVILALGEGAPATPGKPGRIRRDPVDNPVGEAVSEGRVRIVAHQRKLESTAR